MCLSCSHDEVNINFELLYGKKKSNNNKQKNPQTKPMELAGAFKESSFFWCVLHQFLLNCVNEE